MRLMPSAEYDGQVGLTPVPLSLIHTHKHSHKPPKLHPLPPVSVRAYTYLRNIACAGEGEDDWAQILWQQTGLDLTAQGGNGGLGSTAAGIVVGGTDVLKQEGGQDQ